MQMLYKSLSPALKVINRYNHLKENITIVKSLDVSKSRLD